MTQLASSGDREVEFRACCGKLRWALLDAVESLPAGTRVAKLRWGPAEIALDVEAGAGQSEPAVDAILAAVRRQLGAGAFCYAGRGTLVMRREARLRMTVSRRVAGEGKCAATYVKVLEDLARQGGQSGQAHGLRIVAAGFLGYRMIRLDLGVPPDGDGLHAELAAAQLRDALRAGLGVDPRMLSGRLAVLVEAPGDGAATVAGLRECGYTVTTGNGEAIS